MARFQVTAKRCQSTWGSAAARAAISFAAYDQGSGSRIGGSNACSAAYGCSRRPGLSPTGPSITCRRYQSSERPQDSPHEHLRRLLRTDAAYLGSCATDEAGQLVIGERYGGRPLRHVLAQDQAISKLGEALVDDSPGSRARVAFPELVERQAKIEIDLFLDGSGDNQKLRHLHRLRRLHRPVRQSHAVCAPLRCPRHPCRGRARALDPGPRLLRFRHCCTVRRAPGKAPGWRAGCRRPAPRGS